MKDKSVKKNIDPEIFLRLDRDEEKLEFLIKLSSLAPSSHNTQPWIFKIDGLRISILPNFSRALGSSDKQDRQLYLSLGAAMGNLIIASRSYGLEFEIIHDRDNLGVTHIQYGNLKSTIVDKNTLNALIQRHNNRFNFNKSTIPLDLWEKIKFSVKQPIHIHIISDSNTKEKISSIIQSAVKDSFLDKEFTKELSNWIKPPLKKYKLGMPSYNLEIPFPISFLMPWMLRHLNLAGMQVKMHHEQLANAPYYAILTADDTLDNWLNAGVALAQLAIEAQKNNLKIGILTAAIEVGEYYKQLQEILGTTERPLVFFRLGYTDKIPFSSPRLDVDQIIEKN